MIKGKNIFLKYKKCSSPVLKEVSFELKKGRMTTFMGQSGAGKTTLLKCLANLQSYAGVITCKDQDLKSFSSLERATTIGFVHQQYHLFPHLNVLDNCTYALIQTMQQSQSTAEASAKGILKALNMQSFMQAFPSQLSGGQQQRAAIARALSLRPEILLLDEPTSALDPDSKKGLEILLRDLLSQGITLAISSHDMPFIRQVMDQVYFLDQGEVVESWDSQIEELSSKVKIKQFLTTEGLGKN